MSRKGNKSRECVQDGECRPGHKSSKSTREWCKGRVGIEHSWAWVDEHLIPNTYGLVREQRTTRERIVCTVCGKQAFSSRERCNHCHVILREYLPRQSIAAVAKEQAKWKVAGGSTQTKAS